WPHQPEQTDECRCNEQDDEGVLSCHAASLAYPAVHSVTFNESGKRLAAGRCSPGMLMASPAAGARAAAFGFQPSEGAWRSRNSRFLPGCRSEEGRLGRETEAGFQGVP